MLPIKQQNDLMEQNHMVEFTSSLSASTKRAYSTDIRMFFGVENLSEITIEMVQNVNVTKANDYIENLLKQGKSLSTVNRKLQALSKFYTFMSSKRIGMVEYNPFSKEEGARRVKVNKQFSKTRCLTTDEICRMLEVIKSDRTIIGIRNTIIILLLYTTGMRRTELCNLKVGNVDYTDGHHVLRFVGKQNSDRLVEISETIKMLIEKYLQLRGLTIENKEESLFVSHSSNKIRNSNISGQTVANIVKNISKKAGLDASNITPHCFRHSFITEAIKTWGIGVAQELAGHSSINTTRIYDHTNDVLETKASSSLLDNLGVEINV